MVGAANGLKINPEIIFEEHEELNQMFINDYVLPERQGKPMIDRVLKLILKEHQSFPFRPRRISMRKKLS